MPRNYYLRSEINSQSISKGIPEKTVDDCCHNSRLVVACGVVEIAQRTDQAMRLAHICPEHAHHLLR
ncbi:hypothetical protein [Hyphomicrobium sp. MC8b]|uniref:hypothetical protein n=1 Tax=unclassified Hyphomicrobium TaxID=2619925 RepID=UPI00391C249A